MLFNSYSSNLVDNVDDNGVADLFVRDRVAGTTKLVSVATDGTSGNAGTYVGGSLSNDGRYVAFSSTATDLVAGSHFGNDLYVRDLQTDTTTYIALPGPVDDVWNVTLSGDGNVIAFNSPQHHVPDDTDAGGVDTFVYDRTTGQTERVSVDSNEQESVVNGSGAEFNDVAINDDGSVVAFVTPYSGLVAGDTNGTNDVFVHDRNAGTTERVSVTSAGGQATGHSGTGFTNGSNIDLDSSGRHVLFLSDANNLVPGDTGSTDVFLHDRQTAKTTRVSTDRSERQLNAPSSDAAIDGAGRIVAFTSGATNALDARPELGRRRHLHAQRGRADHHLRFAEDCKPRHAGRAHDSRLRLRAGNRNEDLGSRAGGGSRCRAGRGHHRGDGHDRSRRPARGPEHLRVPQCRREWWARVRRHDLLRLLHRDGVELRKETAAGCVGPRPWARWFRRARRLRGRASPTRRRDRRPARR